MVHSEVLALLKRLEILASSRGFNGEELEGWVQASLTGAHEAFLIQDRYIDRLSMYMASHDVARIGFLEVIKLAESGHHRFGVYAVVIKNTDTEVLVARYNDCQETVSQYHDAYQLIEK